MTSDPVERITTRPAYAERLGVPLWSWPLMLTGGGLVAAEIGMGVTGVPLWLPFVVALPLTVAALLRAGRIKVKVTADELLVDDARLPLSAIAEVVALDAAGKREALGVGAHPLAFVIQRPWIGGAVQVLLNDPDDPTPFWVISTRHPVELATQLLGTAGR